MENLIEEFNAIENLPIFEIEIDGDYYIYYIQASEKGLEAGGCSNIGFMPYGISLEWEEGYSLDYHLEGLYELCYEKSLEE